MSDKHSKQAPPNGSFDKYVAVGNDFIVFDNRNEELTLSASRIRKLCDRRLGIGADGLLLLGRDDRADFRMHYYNADGSRGEMCGNGARSLIRFAADRKVAGRHGGFIADDGRHRFHLLEDGVQVEILVPGSLQSCDVPQPGCGLINTGVPHLLVPEMKTRVPDLDALGREMNRHPAFPEGTNVNLIRLEGDTVHVRTWERGVNAETLACGTGAVASAVFAVENWDRNWPVSLSFPGGKLVVDHGGDGYWLSGAAELVFRGHVNLSES